MGILDEHWEHYLLISKNAQKCIVNLIVNVHLGMSEKQGGLVIYFQTLQKLIF